MTSRPTLAALLQGRSRSARVQFVAELYAARGATTRVDGNVVVVDGDRYLVASRLTGVVASLRRRTHRSPGIDHVVAVEPVRADALATRYDAGAVSAADLDRLARYGLDRERADRVFEEQFGRPVDAVGVPPSDHGRLGVGTDDSAGTEPAAATGPSRAGRGQTVRFVAAGVLALLLFGVAFSGAGATTGSLPWVWDASETVSVSTPVEPDTPVSTSDPVTDASTASTSPPSWFGGDDVTPTEFAPGVSGAGVTDVDALAAAHAAALENRSYRWDLEYVESVDGTVTARGTETVRVASRRRYVSQVDWRGVPVGFTPVASQPSYADGEVRHRPAGNGTVETYALTDLPPAGEQGWRASRYVGWYLETTNSSVERTLVHSERPTAVVEATGTTYPNTENYTVSAHVTDEGFVRSLSVSYVLTPDAVQGDGDGTGRPVTVQFTFRYHVDGPVSVTPPPWYTAAEATRAG